MMKKICFVPPLVLWTALILVISLIGFSKHSDHWNMIAKSWTDHICRKLKGKLASWKAQSLPKAGRLVLIKSSLSASANYSMQVLSLPKSTLSEIDQICAIFLWDSTPDHKITHLTSWLQLCGDSSYGRLSVRYDVLMNQTLMTKLFWMFNSAQNLSTYLIRKNY